MKSYDFNFYGKTYKIYVEYSTYENNNALAEILNCESEEEGFEGQLEEFAIASVNLNDSWYLDENEAYIDTNNVEGIEEFLVENDLAEKVKGEEAKSGFCTYPLYRFKSIENEWDDEDDEDIEEDEIEA